ncbi:hypothetical protein B0G81_2221 [Paraburkholderia sp. BL6665CI2N2]|nr:hypothetical protein B0G81_2221 [Paraburkholderia sp. BL6665CI2N2]
MQMNKIRSPHGKNEHSLTYCCDPACVVSGWNELLSEEIDEEAEGVALRRWKICSVAAR